MNLKFEKEKKINFNLLKSSGKKEKKPHCRMKSQSIV